jgi:hypothetical protein
LIDVGGGEAGGRRRSGASPGEPSNDTMGKRALAPLLLRDAANLLVDRPEFVEIPGVNESYCLTTFASFI